MEPRHRQYGRQHSVGAFTGITWHRQHGRYNTGSTNTGGFNDGDFNTGFYNTGDYNTGYHNTGDVNTGAFIGGNFSNGAFWQSDRRPVGRALRNHCPQIPLLNFSLNIPVNIPIHLGFTLAVNGFRFHHPPRPPGSPLRTHRSRIAGLPVIDINITATPAVHPRPPSRSPAPAPVVIPFTGHPAGPGFRKLGCRPLIGEAAHWQTKTRCA